MRVKSHDHLSHFLQVFTLPMQVCLGQRKCKIGKNGGWVGHAMPAMPHLGLGKARRSSTRGCVEESAASKPSQTCIDDTPIQTRLLILKIKSESHPPPPRMVWYGVCGHSTVGMRTATAYNCLQAQLSVDSSHSSRVQPNFLWPAISNVACNPKWATLISWVPPRTLQRLKEPAQIPEMHSGSGSQSASNEGLSARV